MHDLREINVPNEILTKPSALTPSEFDAVKMHSEWGAELIRGMDKIYSERDYRAILEHHESATAQDILWGRRAPRSRYGQGYCASAMRGTP